MAFTDRVKVIIDVVADKATTAVNGFRDSISNANGFGGKLKAGLGSLAGSFKSFITSPMGAATAITAGALAMEKMISAASDLALEVGQLADATALSTESASRWVEVSKDLGLSSDQLSTIIRRMTKNLGETPEAFAKVGIELQHAADGSADMGQTLLVAMGRLNDIKDPTERAAVAAKLFGKSWADAAELIAMGADGVAKRLADVSDAKIIDKSEIEQAREFRDAMDDFKDVGEDLVITIGQALIPVLTEVAHVLTALAPAVELVGDTVKETDDKLTLAKESWHEIFSVLRDDVEGTVGPLFKYKGQITEIGEATVVFGDASKEAAQKQTELKESVDRTRRASEQAIVKWQLFMDALSEEEKISVAEDAMADLRKEFEETGKVSDDTRFSIENLVATTIGQGNLLGTTNFKIAVDTGQLETAQRIMDHLAQIAAAGLHLDVTTGMIADSSLRNLMERGTR